MMARILDGNALALQIKTEIKEQIRSLGKAPRLAVLLCSNDPASKIYVQKKVDACAEVGIDSFLIKPFGKMTIGEAACDGIIDVPMKILLDRIDELNHDKSIDGILVQLPLPNILNQQEVFDRIHPLKDVDVFSPVNVGLLLQGRPRLVPCTPAGIQELLVRSDISTEGKKVAIINRSDIVGKPLQALLSQNNSRANATCTLCHDHTPPETLKEVCLSSDIIVVAVGIPNFLQPHMVSKGVVVIDVGINRLATKQIVGDVHPDVYPLTSAYTPVPGGVGPMTVAMLLKNTLIASQLISNEQQGGSNDNVD